VAGEWVSPKTGNKGEAADATASAWSAAVSACFAKGGHVTTSAELAELIGHGMPGGTNKWQWGADNSTVVTTSATASALRWTATTTPTYANGTDFSTLSKTSTQAYRCAYYPVDTSYTGPATSACAGGCKEIALPGGSGAKLWFDTFDRAPSAALTAAIDGCRKVGGHLASHRDLVEAIRSGLGNGSSAYVWSGDYSMVLSNPISGSYTLRASTVRWTGTDAAFADVYGTSSSSSDPTSARPYRCMWTNETR
jgi:hypothetical protein